MQTCYRHSDRETGVSCSSCGRPICTDCMTPTPVGMRCPECARQKTKVKTAATAFAPAAPRATYAIVAVNVAVFLVQVLSAGGGARASSGEVYDKGALVMAAVDDGEWWRLVSSGFLHADPFHILLNMVGVYFLGTLLEPAVGTVRFVGLYFASLLAGSLGALLLSQPLDATVGASGAVFGLLGAAFVMLRARGVDPMQSWIGPILIINIVLSFRPGISIGGHLGGLVGGVLAAYILLEAEKRRSPALAVVGCLVLGLAAIVASIAAAAAGMPTF